MGVYYYFYNVTRQVYNELPIPNMETKYVSKMHSFDKMIMRNVFMEVVLVNDWSSYDVIYAEPDYHEYPLIVYENMTVRIINHQVIGTNLEDWEDDIDSDDESLEELPTFNIPESEDPVCDMPDWDEPEDDYDW